MRLRLRVLNNFLVNKSFDKRIKKTVFPGLLNVALPTFDVYSDLAVSIHFFRGSKKTRQHTTMQNSGLA